MRKTYVLSIISLLIVILLSACSKWVAYPIELPASDDVASISIVSGDITVSCTDEEWIGEVMSVLMDMKPTSKLSVNDFPTVEDYITIYLNCFDNTNKRVFFYEEHGQEYVEQAYLGIYRPDPSLGIQIRDLLESLDE